ncbi:sigma-70 family RNA polymerase sigma factor [Pseudonocardia tropica]|jgi:RNA polymerase sigma-70 factor (ECF subfamily)|uniref:Sigma-70 family RNA polymerase sigma factor n=2 Tax=Pseudonocardia TaxID=1847 RepID=A0ABV1K312_9PSEU|nr:MULTISPECIES: sigma-70 family RNA polymerase sigma factor [Pseudonocardia]MBO4240145.1 sigma-70 family RNA polymerase sigma factor [Pseudonocardia alni]WFG43389.1 sigma-70 family RNA polymerase sigma factor [Pseudonocardia alni]
MSAPARAADTTVDERPPEERLEDHRRELTGYCYRMLGSAFEAEDAVQDTMVRAWKGVAKFDGRSSLRSWLYRIATNVCIDALNGRKRRAVPMDIGGPGAPVAESLREPLPDAEWLEPMPDARVSTPAGDPADKAVAKETIRLAFIAALQHLPARQRAVLILREVLCWKAAEVAELLDTSVASVNSALQRARATLGEQGISEAAPQTSPAMDPAQTALLMRYMAAFEAFDMEALTALLHEDVEQNMPPLELWFRGRDDVIAWMATGPGQGCRGSRVAPVEINGTVGFAQWKPSGPNGEFEAWGITALRIEDGAVTGLSIFLNTELFGYFGLPLKLADRPELWEPKAG